MFAKYRSDYQVGSILAGEASEEVRSRAGAARLDERFALVRLLLDALDSSMDGVMQRERTIALVRDVLRNEKDGIIAGQLAGEAIDGRADELAAGIRRRVEADVATDAQLGSERMAVSQLRDYALACKQEHVEAGEEAFAFVNRRYAAASERFRTQVEAESDRLTCALAFLDEVYGDGREMNAFMAELAARPAIAQFVAKFGNAAYFDHASKTQAFGGANALAARVGEFDLQAATEAQAAADAAKSCGRCCSC